MPSKLRTCGSFHCFETSLETCRDIRSRRLSNFINSLVADICTSETDRKITVEKRVKKIEGQILVYKKCHQLPLGGDLFVKGIGMIEYSGEEICICDPLSYQ